METCSRRLMWYDEVVHSSCEVCHGGPAGAGGGRDPVRGVCNRHSLLGCHLAVAGAKLWFRWLCTAQCTLQSTQEAGHPGKTCKGLHERSESTAAQTLLKGGSEKRPAAAKCSGKVQVGWRWSSCQPVANAKARLWFQVALWCSGGRCDGPHVKVKVYEDLHAPRNAYVDAMRGPEACDC